MQNEEKQKHPDRISSTFIAPAAPNVGQITQTVAFELARQGVGRLFCLAGIAAHLKGFVTSARQIEETVVLDGCEIGCGKKILADNDVAMTHYFVITEQGLKKANQRGSQPEEVAQVLETIRRLIPDAATTAFSMAGTVK